MRDQVCLGVPEGQSARQLLVFAALVDRLRRKDWGYLADLFDTMDRTVADWPEPTETMLAALSAELRRAAAERPATAAAPAADTPRGSGRAGPARGR
jgi:hypothetical protein